MAFVGEGGGRVVVVSRVSHGGEEGKRGRARERKGEEREERERGALPASPPSSLEPTALNTHTTHTTKPRSNLRVLPRETFGARTLSTSERDHSQVSARERARERDERRQGHTHRLCLRARRPPVRVGPRAAPLTATASIWARRARPGSPAPARRPREGASLCRNRRAPPRLSLALSLECSPRRPCSHPRAPPPPVLLSIHTRHTGPGRAFQVASSLSAPPSTERERERASERHTDTRATPD